MRVADAAGALQARALHCAARTARRPPALAQRSSAGLPRLRVLSLDPKLRFFRRSCSLGRLNETEKDPGCRSRREWGPSDHLRTAVQAPLVSPRDVPCAGTRRRIRQCTGFQPRSPRQIFCARPVRPGRLASAPGLRVPLRSQPLVPRAASAVPRRWLRAVRS
jgi:hypothetical protein